MCSPMVDMTDKSHSVQDMYWTCKTSVPEGRLDALSTPLIQSQYMCRKRWIHSHCQSRVFLIRCGATWEPLSSAAFIVATPSRLDLRMQWKILGKNRGEFKILCLDSALSAIGGMGRKAKQEHIRYIKILLPLPMPLSTTFFEYLWRGN